MERVLPINICERCGLQFECLAQDIKKCWCNALHLTEEERKSILLDYTNCLCENCLMIYSKK